MAKLQIVRYDRSGPIKVMALVDGWLMVRRPGSSPFTLRLETFEKLPDNAEDGKNCVWDGVNVSVSSRGDEAKS